MQKQAGNKKGLIWALIAAGALVLVAALVLGIVFLGGFGSNKDSAPIELYWNVERSQYVAKGLNGTSGRMPRSDGYYYVRFSKGGEQVDLQVVDAQLIQKIDQLDVMGLEFDDQGVVVDVYNINECTGGLVAGSLYVAAVEGNTLVCNTQAMLKGVQVNVEITEDTQVYDVGQVGLLCGMSTTVAVDHEIYAIKDYAGKIIYIYTKGYAQPGEVYWNLERKYDSTSKTSTREMDASGCFSFEMAFNGEVVTVKTRDYKIANAIDAKAARCTGLVFDENGYVVEVTSAGKTAGGSTFASWANVFRVNGSEVFCRKLIDSNAGTEYLGNISKDCKIINVSGVGGEIGSYTTLQYGDQIHGLTDVRGRVCYIWVISRLGSYDGWELFWNVERKYDSTTKTTKRIPAADGYYYIEVATGGEKRTVKTNDKTIADKLDSYAARCFTMKLGEDNEIERIGSATMSHGGGTFGSWYYVDAIEGDQLTVSRILTGDTEPTVMRGTIAEAVEIINGSTNYNSHCGEYTQLNVGDRVHCLKDLEGNIRVIFVVEKAVHCPVYWNIGKKAVTNGVTTRERAEDGYFYFQMAVDGKQCTLKTKDLALATKIDNVAARCMGLQVTAEGVITKFIGISAVNGCQGGTKSMSWVDVTGIYGATFSAQKNQAGHKDNGKVFTTTMAPGCKIYNVSSNYKVFSGEQTTLRTGDRVHVLHNRQGQAVYVFVVERKMPLEEKQDCPCNLDATWLPWDGVSALEDGGYYYLTQDVTAPVEGFVLENMAVSLRLDGHTISSEGRCFYLKSGARLNICDHETRGKIVGSGVNDESGGVLRVYSSGAVLNMWNVDVQRKDAGTTPLEGGLISCSGTVSLYNCDLAGGKATSKGGNLQIPGIGTFRMFGGTMTGGSAPTGGNINLTGRIYMEDVTVSGGSIYSNSEEECVYNGLISDNLGARKGKITLKGKTVIDKLTLNDECTLADGGITEGSRVLLVSKPETSRVVMTGASQTAYAALCVEDAQDYALSYDESKKTVTVTNVIQAKEHSDAHCACAGTAEELAVHSCETLYTWTQITEDVFEDAVGLDGKVAGIRFKENGCYYLSLDYQTSKSICIMPDQDITICLNGSDVISSTRTFLVAGKLTITDCRDAGRIIGANSTNGGAIKLLSGATVDLYAGAVYNEMTCTSSGGVIAICTDGGNIVDNSTPMTSVLNMYGGTVTGGKASKGGNIGLWSNACFYMYGGTVTGGTAVEFGGNISLQGSAASVVKLVGGTVTGGSCDTAAGIYYGAGQLIIGGDVQLGGNLGSDLYLATGKTVTLEGYNGKSTVSVAMAQAGVFAQAATDLSAAFTSADSQYAVAYDKGKLKLDLNAAADGHIHCLCSGSAKDLYTHECSNLLYEPWDGTTELTSGNYYLTKNVSLTDPQGLLVGTNQINLCLNGFKIMNETGRAFYLKNSGGVLNVCDHAGNSGAVEAVGVENEGGGVVRIGSVSATFGAYNVTLRRIDTGTRTKVSEGGIITCAGQLELYNATLENGYAYKGGNLNLVNVSKAVVVNSTITGGVAVENATGGDGVGGNVRISGNTASDPATVILVDSTVTLGNAQSGNGIYLAAANSLLKLGGKINITNNNGHNLYMLGNSNLVLENLSQDSVIGISQKTPGVIAQSENDLSGCFQSDAGLTVYHEDSNLCMGNKHRNHCVCAGGQTTPEGHSCSAVSWIELTQQLFTDATATSDYVRFDGTNYYLQSGYNYYLAESISVTKPLALNESDEVSLCLNGMNLHGNGVRTWYFKGTLTLCDCQYTDSTVGEQIVRTYKGTVTSTSKGHAHIFYARSGGTFYFYGGELIGHAVGAGYSSNSGTGTVGGWMYMYGGVIRDGDCSANDKSGGNIRVDGVFEMYAGTITGGKAKEGGNIAVAANGNAKLAGGVVEKGEAVSGGNLVVFGALTVEKQAMIRDGVSTGTVTATGGGNIYGYPNNTNIQITGGQILDGKAGKNGANIYIRSNANGSNAATLQIIGGTISGVHADSASGCTSIYLQKNSGVFYVYVGGNARVDEICCDTAGMLQIAQSGITREASIGVSLTSGNGTVISNVGSQITVDLAQVIYAVSENKQTALDGNKLVIEDQ